VLYAATGEIVRRYPCDVGSVGPSHRLLAAYHSGDAARETDVRVLRTVDDCRPACTAADEVVAWPSCSSGDPSPPVSIAPASMYSMAARDNGVPVLRALYNLRIPACSAFGDILAIRVEAPVTVVAVPGIGALPSPTADDLRREFVLLADDGSLRVAAVESFRADWEAVAVSGARPVLARPVCARSMGGSFPAAAAGLLL
jgi:hypothetical protein